MSSGASRSRQGRWDRAAEGLRARRVRARGTDSVGLGLPAMAAGGGNAVPVEPDGTDAAWEALDLVETVETVADMAVGAPEYRPASLPPGRAVDLPGRGTTWIHEHPGPAGAPTVVLLHGWTVTGGLN